MRRTGEGPQLARRRRRVYSGHILRKACFPRRGEAVLGGDYVVSLPEEKQRKRLSRLWRASVSNPNFRFVSRFRSPPLTSGRRGFLCGRFLHPLLSVPLCSRYLFQKESCLIICFKDGSSYHRKMGWTGIFSDHTFGR